MIMLTEEELIEQIKKRTYKFLIDDARFDDLIYHNDVEDDKWQAIELIDELVEWIDKWQA